MHYPCSMRRENGAVLVLSLLMLAILLVVGSGTLTTSRIETQIASSDTKGKQVVLAAEYALAVGEATAEQAGCENGCVNALDDTLKSRAGLLHGTVYGLYGKREQPAWGNCLWDDRDSMDTTPYFGDPTNPPQMLRDPHDRPRVMVARKHFEPDSLSLANTAGITYVTVSAHGARAQWTALGNGQPDDRPGSSPQNQGLTYNDRYPGTRVVLQSIYAKRYK